MKLKYIMAIAATTLLVGQQANAHGTTYTHKLTPSFTYSTYGDFDDFENDKVKIGYHNRDTYRIGTKQILQILLDHGALGEISSIRGLSITTLISYADYNEPHIDEGIGYTFVVDKQNNYVADISEYVDLDILDRSDNHRSISSYYDKDVYGKKNTITYATTSVCQVQLALPGFEEGFPGFFGDMQGVLDLGSRHVYSYKSDNSTYKSVGGVVQNLSGEAYNYWEWYNEEGGLDFEGIVTGSIKIGKSEEWSNEPG